MILCGVCGVWKEWNQMVSIGVIGCTLWLWVLDKYKFEYNLISLHVIYLV